MTLDKEYLLPLKDNKYGLNRLSIELKYNLGGNNGYREEARGYYLHVQPVKIAGMFREITAYTGTKMLMKEVTRKSKAAEKLACQKADEKLQMLVDHVLSNNGIELADGTTLEEVLQ